MKRRRAIVACALMGLFASLTALGTATNADIAFAESGRVTPAERLLDRLPTRAEAPVARVSGFGRDGDTCSIGSRVLRRDGTGVRADGCAVRSGTWSTPFSPVVSSRPTGVALIRLVSPREAMRSGAARWSTAERTAYANDTSSKLLHVVPRAMAAEREGRQPTEWLPPKDRCAYVAQWISVKTRWGLAVDDAERARLQSVLDGCGDAAAGTAPSARSTADAAPMPTGDSGPWHQIIAQDFSRDTAVGGFEKAYPGWSQYDTGRDSSATLGRPEATQGEYRNDRTVQVSDGALRCDLHTEGVRPMLCAVTPALGDGKRPVQQYGKYVVRFKTDRVPGYKIAWLLWPTDNDWRKGEIDFPEAELDQGIWAATHRIDGDPSQNAAIFDTKAKPTDWHTATIEWTPGELVFDLDGRRWSTTEKNGLPQTRMEWALQAESQLESTPPDRAVRGGITIDWLTAYSYRP